MTLPRMNVLCVFLATLLATGCAGRQRVSSVPTPSPNSKSNRADAGPTNDVRTAMEALRESLRKKKSAPSPQVRAPRPSDSGFASDSRHGEHVIGTSGKWVVTTTTQRPAEPVASPTAQTANAQRAEPQDGVRFRLVGPVLVAALLLILGALVAARATRRVSQRH